MTGSLARATLTLIMALTLAYTDQITDHSRTAAAEDASMEENIEFANCLQLLIDKSCKPEARITCPENWHFWFPESETVCSGAKYG